MPSLPKPHPQLSAALSVARLASTAHRAVRLAGLFAAVASTAWLGGCGGGGGFASAYDRATSGLNTPVPPPPAAPPPLASGTGGNALPTTDSLACVCTGLTASTCAPKSANLAPNACTPEGEKRWLRSYISEAYLFYKGTDSYVAQEPSTREAANYLGTPENYFTLLTTTANPLQDRFSFSLSKIESDVVFGGGTTAGYGIELSGATPSYRIIYTQPNSPASLAGVPRGAALASVNGEAMVTQNGRAFFPTQRSIDALFSPALGQSVSLGIIPQGASQPIVVTMRAVDLVPASVLLSKTIATPTGKVGYISFMDHLSPSQYQMADAIAGLAAEGVSDLVLDMRYNGGGYVVVAAQVAYLIGGRNVSDTPVFVRLTYNDKRTADSFTYPFERSYVRLPGSDQRAGALPATLNLPRVYVLTQSGTCSASEGVINGLKGTRVGGLGVEVIQIGSTTCGKPYGFSDYDNALSTHYAIEFDGKNNKGEGGYINGIAANCPAADDLSKPLGDPSEGMLARALAVRAGASCTPSSLGREGLAAASANAPPVGRTLRHAMAGQALHVRQR